MTINITPEIEDAYRQFLAEQVDSFVGGQPIYRRDTAPYSTMRFSGLVDFAAGHQAARAALAAVQPPLAAQSEQPQGNLAVSTSGDVHGDAGRNTIGTLCLTAPERIWLQVDPEEEHDGKPVYTGDDEVTWCADQVNDSDTLYIRADLAGYRRPGADG